MSKKLILSIAVLTLLSLAIFVSAFYDSEDKVIIVDVHRGWNLIPTASIEITKHSDSSINYNDLKYGYVFDRNSKEYWLFLKDGESQYNPDDSSGAWFSEDEFLYGIRSSFWAYSDKEGKLIYYWKDVSEEFTNINTYDFKKGWNFITITPEMIEYSLNEIKGNCEFQEIYAYGKEGGTIGWMDLLNNPNFMDEKLDNPSAGQGMVIKVTNGCLFGTNGWVAPPKMPGIVDNLGAREIIENEFYKEYSYEACELNNAKEFDSVEECYSGLKCAAEIYASLIPPEDVDKLANYMQEHGGESGYIYYQSESPEFSTDKLKECY